MAQRRPPSDKPLRWCVAPDYIEKSACPIDRARAANDDRCNP